MPFPSDNPAEPQKLPCPRHPQSETRLRCTECEGPICPKCMVMYEAGFKCPACARKRPAHISQIAAWQGLLAGFGSVMLGFVYGWLHPFLFGFIPTVLGLPVLACILAFALGYGLGQVLHRLIRYKISRWLGLMVGCGVFLGALLAPAMQFLIAEFLTLLQSMQIVGGNGGSVEFYLVRQGLQWLGPFLFARGLSRPFFGG